MEIDENRAIELAKAAKAMNISMTSEDAFETILQDIPKISHRTQRMRECFYRTCKIMEKRWHPE